MDQTASGSNLTVTGQCLMLCFVYLGVRAEVSEFICSTPSPSSPSVYVKALQD